MSADLDQLAFRFFKLFARFEATLKEREFYRVESGRIVVQWDRFANEVVGDDFLADLGDKADSASYILDEPPKKQGPNEEGKIVWLDVAANDKSAQALFGHIRRMRNNLYHGAKFNGTWFDPQRSERLLGHGLVVLEHYSRWLQH
jgi:hypothetical protein